MTETTTPKSPWAARATLGIAVVAAVAATLAIAPHAARAYYEQTCGPSDTKAYTTKCTISSCTGWWVSKQCTTDGSYYYNSSSSAPVIRQVRTGNHQAVTVTALLHRTARFQLRVTTIVTPAGRPPSPTVLGHDSLKTLGIIPLGLEHAGIQTLHFKLQLRGRSLKANSYTLFLEALRPNGKLRSRSAPLLIGVVKGGRVVCCGPTDPK